MPNDLDPTVSTLNAFDELSERMSALEVPQAISELMRRIVLLASKHGMTLPVLAPALDLAWDRFVRKTTSPTVDAAVATIVHQVMGVLTSFKLDAATKLSVGGTFMGMAIGLLNDVGLSKDEIMDGFRAIHAQAFGGAAAAAATTRASTPPKDPRSIS